MHGSRLLQRTLRESMVSPIDAGRSGISDRRRVAAVPCLPARSFGLRAIASWIAHAVNSFALMPPHYQGQGIAAARLPAVLQGRDMTEQEVLRQSDVALESGVNRYLVAYTEVERSWQPRIVELK